MPALEDLEAAFGQLVLCQPVLVLDVIRPGRIFRVWRIAGSAINAPDFPDDSNGSSPDG